MMATPASARRSAVRSARSVGTEPSAKAWLTATLPFRPAASVRCGDRHQLGDAALAAVVQMDVDTHAAAFGDGEDRIEMAVEIAVDADGIEAAHEVGALGDGGV